MAFFDNAKPSSQPVQQQQPVQQTSPETQKTGGFFNNIGSNSNLAQNSSNAVLDFVNRQSAYQQNMSQPLNTKWYAGAIPTKREIYGRIYEIGKTDPNKAATLSEQFGVIQADITSPWYEPYKQVTNKAVSQLSALGVDTSNIDDKWFEDNRYLMQYLRFDGSTNAPSALTKKSSPQEQAAWYYYQIAKANEDTKTAQKEYAALQEEINTLVSWGDRNYSDQQIKDYIYGSDGSKFAKKYPMLAKMDATAKGVGGIIEFNSAIDYSKDNVDTMIWRARNGGGTGNMDFDACYSVAGFGKGWVENPGITAKLNKDNPDTFSPYEVGSTMDDVMLYFGVQNLDRETLDQILANPNWDDETWVEMYTNAEKGYELTERLKAQEAAIYADVDALHKKYSKPSDIKKLILANEDAYKDLFALDKSLQKGSEYGKLLPTTSAVDYRWAKVEKYIDDVCGPVFQHKVVKTPDLIWESTFPTSPEVTQEEVIEDEQPEAQEEPFEYKGTIDIDNRPVVHNDDGSISTIRSISIGVDGKEVLIPTVIDGKIVSDEEAIDHYYQTLDEGHPEHLGIFDTVEEADAYAAELSKRQGEVYEEEEPEITEEPVTETPSPAPVETPKPVQPNTFTEAEVAMEESRQLALADLEMAVESAGTDSEKLALQTGKTGLFHEAMHKLVEGNADFKTGLKNSINRQINDSYVDDVRVIYDYSEHEKNRDYAQAELERINPELVSLGNRLRKTEAISNLSPKQYSALMNLPNTDGWEMYADILSHPERAEESPEQAKLYDEALLYLYRQTNVNAFGNQEWGVDDMEMARELAPGLFEYLQSIQSVGDKESPLDIAKRQAQETGEYTVEVLAQTGGLEGDDVDTVYTVRFEPDDHGHLHFKLAVGNVTGEPIADEKELNEILGYIPPIEPLSEEEMERYNILTSKKEDEEQKIAEENDWLTQHDASYKTSLKNKQHLETTLAIAQFTGADVSADILQKAELTTKAAQIGGTIKPAPFSMYDMYVNEGMMSREEASAQSAITAQDNLRYAQDIRSTLESLDADVMSEAERQNALACADALEREGMAASYTALDGNADFVTMFTQGMVKADKDKGLAKLLTHYGTQLPERDSQAYYDLQNQLIKEGALNSTDLMLDWYNILESVSQEEVMRYFYLYNKDSADDAKNYFNFINDPDYGELTVRKNQNWQEFLANWSDKGALYAGGAWLASVGMKPVANASALIYRLTGGKSTVNPMSSMLGDVGALRKGTENYVENILGKNTFFGQAGVETLRVATGLADIWVNNKVMSGLTSLFGGSSIAAELGGSALSGTVTAGENAAMSVLGLSIDSSNAKWQQVLAETGDVNKANQMSLVTFFSSMLNHAVILKGLGNILHGANTAFASKLGQFGGNLFTNAATIGGATALTESIEKDIEKEVLGEDSFWDKAYKKYKGMDYSDTMAASAADADTWSDISDKVSAVVVSSLIRTTLVTGAKELPGATRKVLNYIFPKRGEGISSGDYQFNPNTLTYEEENPYGAEWAGKYKPGEVRWFKSSDGSPVYVKDTVTKQSHVIYGYRYDRSTDTTYLINANGLEIPMGAVDVGWLNEISPEYSNAAYGLFNDIRSAYDSQSGVFTPAEPVTGETVNSEGFNAQNEQNEQPSTSGTVNPNATNATATPQTTGGTVNLTPGYPSAETNFRQMQKDSTLLMGIYNTNPTSSSVIIASVLSEGNDAASIAAGQKLVGDIALNDPKLAAYGVQSLLLNGLSKSDMTYAALTDGTGNEALGDAMDKLNAGEIITPADVKAIQDGLSADRLANPQSFEQNFQDSIKESMVANRTLEIMCENGAHKRIVSAQTAVDTARTNLSFAERVVQDAFKRFETIGQNLKQVESQYDMTGETAAPLQQTRKQYVGASNEAAQAEQNQEIAEAKLEKEQKKLDEVTNDELAQARPQAVAEVEQQIQQQQEEAYTNAVAKSKPVLPFKKSVEMYDTDGKPVRIVGVYDYIQSAGMAHNASQFPGFTMFATEDGGLVMDNNPYDAEGNYVGDTPGTVNVDTNTPVVFDAFNKVSDWNIPTKGKNKGIDPRRNTFAPPNYAYFPRSFPAIINGEKVHMIGLAGKQQEGDGFYTPVFLGMDGKNYSSNDPRIEVPFDYTDSVFDLFDAKEESLPVVENIEPYEEANNNGEGESVSDRGTAVPGPVQEGNNGGELSEPLGRNDGQGSLGNAPTERPEEGQVGGLSESESEHNAPKARRGDSRFFPLIFERVPKDIKGNVEKSLTDPSLHETTDYKLFSSSLDQHKIDDPHGIFVDAQTPEQLEEKGAITYLSDDGYTGVAIGTKGKEAGNIVGVFNNRTRNKTGGTMPFLMCHAIEAGGNKLDCYDGVLSRNYTQYGFIPVARLPFNIEYAPPGWDTKKYGEPDVVVWMHNGDSADTVARRYMFTEAQGGYHWYTDEEIQNLPVFTDYDEALAYRDGLLAARDRGNELLYTHGLKNEYAIEGFNAGGFAGIGIGVTRENQGESGLFRFGNEKDRPGVLLVFDESSVDPEKHPENFLFGSDAYTPMFPDNIESRGGKFYNTDTGKEVSFEDVIKEMSEEKLITSRVIKRYSTLHEMKEDAGRLVAEGSKALKFSQPMDDIDDAAMALFDEMEDGDTKSWWLKKGQERVDYLAKKGKTIPVEQGAKYAISDAVNNLISDYYEEGMSAEAMQDLLAQVDVEVSLEAAEKFQNVLDESIKELTDYFEVKLMRKLGLDEISVAIIPYTELETIEAAKAAGVNFIEYDPELTTAQQVAINFNKSRREAQAARTPLDDEGNAIIEPVETINVGDEESTPQAVIPETIGENSQSAGVTVDGLNLIRNGEKIGQYFDMLEGKEQAWLYNTAARNDVNLENALTADGFQYDWENSDDDRDVYIRGAEVRTPPQITGGNVNSPAEGQVITEPPVTPESTPQNVVMPERLLHRNGEPGVGQRQWNVEGAQESQILHDQVKEHLFANADYDKDTNADQLDRAISWLESKMTPNDPTGVYGAIEDFKSEDFNLLSVDGQARIATAMAVAALNDNPEAEQLISDSFYSKSGTDIAQALQFRRVFATMTPKGREYTLRRECERIQQHYEGLGFKFGKPLELSQETLDAAANARTANEFERVRRAAMKELAAQIPSDWRLKVRTFRMFAMLSAPKTHIRNTSGNFFNALSIEMKNQIGASLEKMLGVKQGERTKVHKRTPESVEYAKGIVDSMMDDLQGSGKYYELSEVERNRKAFGTKDTLLSRTLGRFVQRMSDVTGGALEKEDKWFLKYHFIRELSGWMSANGYGPDDMKGDVKRRGLAFAVQKAQEATFREKNSLAKALNDPGHKGLAWTISAVQPFIKTPLNIMRTATRFSPVGLGYTIVNSMPALEKYKQWEDSGFKGKKPKGAKSPSEVVDRLSAGVTGTMLALAGYYLAKFGILKVKASDKDKLNGGQDYSLEVGGKSYGIGSLIPVNISLLFGGAIHDSLSDLDMDDIDPGKVVNVISEILEPIVDTTMMQGLNSLLDTSHYSNGNLTLSTLAQKIAANYVASFFPALVNSITKVADPVQRKAFVESGDSMSIWTAMLEQAQNKFPYFSTKNQPYLNAWGEENPTNGDYFRAFLQNVILPDKVQDLTPNELDDALERIANESGLPGIMPNMTREKYVTINKEKIVLSDKQWHDFSHRKGELAKPTMQELIERPEFIVLSPEAQGKLVKKVYEHTRTRALHEMFPNKPLNATESAVIGMNSAQLVDFIFEREEEAAKSAYVTQSKKTLNISIESYNIEAARTDVSELRQAGVKDSTIKSSVTEYFKPIYREADDYDRSLIENTLRGIGLGYENYDFSKWLN